MGANENNTKNLKDDTYKETTNCRYDIIIEIKKALNVLDEPAYAISDHTPGNNTKSTCFDLLISDDDKIPDNLILDLSKTWDVVEFHEAVSKKVN